MFKKLQQHWGVSGWQFAIIFCVFGVTGTFTAWVSRNITTWLNVTDKSLDWWLLKIAVLLIGYQVFILFFGFLFGQFAFFWKFEKKILTRLGLMKKPAISRLAIFASGAGSNAKKIIEHFAANPKIRVKLIISNKEKAGVIQIAEDNKVESFILNDPDNYDMTLKVLRDHKIDFIILAGYLKKISSEVIKAYSGKIINIHPALLPKHGGKGMYGMRVHETVIANQEKESGITIHYVDEKYDNGEIIFSTKCLVEENDTPHTLAEKIHVLEHRYYPEIIESVIKAKS